MMISQRKRGKSGCLKEGNVGCETSIESLKCGESTEKQRVRETISMCIKKHAFAYIFTRKF